MAERPTTPAYFAIITGPVLDDRVLSDSAKLLYGRITSMTDREGYCWATNKYLSELTGYGERTITRLVAQLEQRGHIWTEVVPVSKTGGRERRIYIGAGASRGIAKIGEGYSQNWRDGVAKNGETLLNSMINKHDNTPLYPPKGETCEKHKSKSEAGWKPERFEAFWKFYRDNARKEDRAGAVKEWDKLKPDDALIDTMAKALRVQVRSEDWQRNIGIPYACRWLKNRRWEDVDLTAPANVPQRRYMGTRVIDGVEVDVYE